MKSKVPYSPLELCAGGGGQALGLEQAWFAHLACVEYEQDFCRTPVLNRPHWKVACQDIREFDGLPYRNRDLLPAGRRAPIPLSPELLENASALHLKGPMAMTGNEKKNVARNAAKQGPKGKILDSPLAHVGQVVSSRHLQEAPGGVAEWARRLRELRDEEGNKILSSKGRSPLKPGEYILQDDHRRPAFRRDISKETRALGIGAKRVHLPNVRSRRRRPRPVPPRPHDSPDHGAYHRQKQGW